MMPTGWSCWVNPCVESENRQSSPGIRELIINVYFYPFFYSISHHSWLAKWLVSLPRNYLVNLSEIHILLPLFKNKTASVLKSIVIMDQMSAIC